MKTQLSKEVFDFLKSFGKTTTSKDGKQFIFVPYIFEVVSESYNTVKEHPLDKELPIEYTETVKETRL